MLGGAGLLNTKNLFPGAGPSCAGRADFHRTRQRTGHQRSRKRRFRARKGGLSGPPVRRVDLGVCVRSGRGEFLAPRWSSLIADFRQYLRGAELWLAVVWRLAGEEPSGEAANRYHPRDGLGVGPAIPLHKEAGAAEAGVHLEDVFVWHV